ncbi:MAG: ribosomal-processing cysteine protease Prp, partial [Clostridia bacterium]|nr:ribosomal-processing cysteine protease Prp [Clostridia bacterium]
LTVATGYLVAYIKKKIVELEEKINNQKVNKYLDIAEDAVCTAVTAVSQTYVNALKNNSQFDQTAQQAAFKMAKDKALVIMGTATQDVLKDLYNDFDAWLDSKIEYYVNTSKSSVSGVRLKLSSIQ